MASQVADEMRHTMFFERFWRKVIRRIIRPPERQSGSMGKTVRLRGLEEGNCARFAALSPSAAHPS